MSTLPIDPASNFSGMARDALKFLHARTKLGFWAITRIEGDEQIVLEAEDHFYGIRPQSVFRFSDTFCMRMLSGEAPSVAPDAQAIPSYAVCPANEWAQIGAYIGVPLTTGDGKLFGTLCAVDPHPQPPELSAELPLVEFIAKLLSALLASELRTAEFSRAAERARMDSETDPLTGLYNRRGWDRILTAEEERCRRYGHGACAIAIDLDSLKRVNEEGGHAAGDELIMRAADCLRSAVRSSEVIARTGGDEFLILASDCDAGAARVIADRVRAVLEESDVAASVGMCRRDPLHGFAEAVVEADRRMYAEKQSRRENLEVRSRE